MGLELWFKDDIRNMLRSNNASSADAARWADGQIVGAYRQGYRAALVAIALACGIEPGEVGIRVDDRGVGAVQGFHPTKSDLLR
jgi:hypothetical protein